jgi:hypothetical protein
VLILLVWLLLKIYFDLGIELQNVLAAFPVLT